MLRRLLNNRVGVDVWTCLSRGWRSSGRLRRVLAALEEEVRTDWFFFFTFCSWRLYGGGKKSSSSLSSWFLSPYA